MTLDQLIQVFPQRFSTTNMETNNKDATEKPPLSIENLEKKDGWRTENNLDILKEIQNYEPYIIICRETMHANQINRLITTTGQQLLCSLNL